MLEQFWQLKDELQIILMGIVVVAALAKGAAPERACAATYLVMWVVDQGYHAGFGRITNAGGADLGHIVIDVLASLSLVGVALYANRNYTLWLASLQLVALFSHFLLAVSPSIDPTAYALLTASPMYLAVIIFGTGVLRHMRRARIFGQYRSWRISSRRNSASFLRRLSLSA